MIAQFSLSTVFASFLYIFFIDAGSLRYVYYVFAYATVDFIKSSDNSGFTKFSRFLKLTVG